MAALASPGAREGPTPLNPPVEVANIPTWPGSTHVAPTRSPPPGTKDSALSAVTPQRRPATEAASAFCVTTVCQFDKAPVLERTAVPLEPVRASTSPVTEPASASGTGVSGWSTTPWVQADPPLVVLDRGEK